jgi:hypothetical protein
MAKDPHANAWIKSLKEGKKQVVDLTDKYVKLFQEDKMTKKDLQEYKQLYPKAKQVADQMWKDMLECEDTISGFGGSGDTFFAGYRGAIASMERKVR